MTRTPVPTTRRAVLRQLGARPRRGRGLRPAPLRAPPTSR
jgi:hypothetical protein